MDDFAEVSKTVEAGATHKSTKDYELSRYACYFQNAGYMGLYGGLDVEKPFSFFAIVDSEYGM